jgi:AbrB family looped-hinge helix DNA binding protein
MDYELPSSFIENGKVMAKGQVTIPKDVRRVLGVKPGNRVTFIVEKGTVHLVNSAIYAEETVKKEFQQIINERL